MDAAVEMMNQCYQDEMDVPYMWTEACDQMYDVFEAGDLWSSMEESDDDGEDDDDDDEAEAAPAIELMTEMHEHEHNHDDCRFMTALVGVGSFMAGVVVTRIVSRRKDELVDDDYRSVL